MMYEMYVQIRDVYTANKDKFLYLSVLLEQEFFTVQRGRAKGQLGADVGHC